MSVKILLAKILQDELAARGVEMLGPSDCEEIAERLVEQITELELQWAARDIANKSET